MQARIKDAVNQAAYATAKGMIGPFAGDAPASAGTPGDPDCASVVVDDPGMEPAGLSSPPEGVCSSSVSGYGACVACVTTWCCAESVACFSEGTCTCLIAARTPGISWPESVKCGEPDDVYSTEIACLNEHCAKECPAR